MPWDIPAKDIGEFTMRTMTEGDAPGVVALYRAIYGEHYPVKEVYDPERIRELHEKGLMIRVVVVDASGRVVGCQAMYRLEEAFPGLYEIGQGMVLPASRAQGFTNHLLAYTIQTLGPALGVEQFWGEAVTNHVFMQKAVLSVKGNSEAGIELEIMPAAAYETERSASGRVSAVVTVSSPIKDKPQDIYLPALYEEIMGEIYGQGSWQRRLQVSDAPLPAGVQTRLAHTYIAGAGMLRLTVLAAGEDVKGQVSSLLGEYQEAGAEVFQVFLPLDKPYSGALTEAMRRQGFFFGAVLPRWFDADGLLLQKLVHPPDWDRIRLYSDFARKLLAFIRGDRNM